MSETTKAPFPWFGGKSKIAPEVWRAFGTVKNYVEPFFGTGAVLRARPDFDPSQPPIETVNDADGFLANFWRALQADPEAVAHFADWPVNEADLHARHGWLVNRKARLTWALEDPDWFDAKIAGWWVWGLCAWIGSGWCSGAGPWVSDGVHLSDNRQLPHLGDAGQGVNRKLPHLGDAGQGVNRQLPHLGGAGQGGSLLDYLSRLAVRMRRVRVACGDWSRVMGDSVTCKHGVTAVFLDPPYASKRAMEYAVDSKTVAVEVRKWCAQNGDNPLFRIVLCGYEGEHDLPGWRQIAWKAAGGYGNQSKKLGRENSTKERLWLSPHCHTEAEPGASVTNDFSLTLCE